MIPTSTYRLQIRPDFDLADAAAVVGYLRDLGVDWAYLSPLLTAAEGSEHGYDVVDPTRVDPARGGAEGLRRFAEAARAAGVGILVDIVPNHMGVASARQNPWWWDVLARGRGSRHAGAFDIDWRFGNGRISIPILGAPMEEALKDVTVDAEAGVVRYFEHELPLAPGSTSGADTTTDVLSRQHWELVHWRDEGVKLNYRRFFTITSLAGVRVEDPLVFDAAHVEILRWLREGLVDGLRIDHPDGLADPGGYLERLAAATSGAYVVVEKILEHSATEHPEALPGWWATAGTTGYDALAEIDRVLIDPYGQGPLDELDARLRGGAHLDWAELVHDAKRAVVDTELTAEVARIVRCLPHPVDRAADALAELLACYPVYRSYLPAGTEWFEQAVAEAVRRRPDLASAIARLAPLLLDDGREVSRRFQQTAGPAMAKGVEDTAFYRHTRLGTLTEVGGDPTVFSLSVDGFHRLQESRQSSWPAAMTALSTHDTKRGEDVRARLSVLSEVPGEWAQVMQELRRHGRTADGALDALLWQAIVGTWPASPERLHAYAEKAAREAGTGTSWTAPDPGFERSVHSLVDAAFGSARGEVERFVDRIIVPGRSNSLSAKLLQLAGPGVPDVYQGSELWDLSLVDPDNRRAVDFDDRRALLARIDAGWLPPIDRTGAAKLLVTSRVLRARRDRSELFTRYRPVSVIGDCADHAVAYDRGGAVAVATRLPVGLADRGGWGQSVLVCPARPMRDVITGALFDGGVLAMRDVLATYPVALLVAQEDT